MNLKPSFDKVTVEKITRSAILSFGGFIVAAIPMLLSDQVVVSFLQAHPFAGVFAGSAVPFVINSIKEWMKEQSS